MKIYKYTFGDWEKYGPANDDTDAYERRVSVDPQFHYVPVVIEEVKLDGYEIIVTMNKATNTIGSGSDYLTNRDYLINVDRDTLKAWLKEKQIDFTPQWGDEKLRELALQHI